MNVKTNQLVMQICMAAIALVGANVLIARMSYNSVPRQVLHRIDADHDATMLAVGNSLMASAFGESTFGDAWQTETAAKIAPMNIALGASGPVEHLLLLRHALAREPKVNLVVYGFFDLQLTEKPVGGWADMTGNRAMSYYVEPYFAAALYAPGSRLQMLQVGLIGRAPMLVERLALWAKVEKIRRALGNVGLPPEKGSEFGRAADFKMMEISDVGHYESLCNGSVDQRLPLTPAIQMMADETNARHAKFVVVEMPMTAEHRSIFYSTAAWQQYRQYVRQLLAERNSQFIDASGWVDDSHFVDDLHLGTQGGENFSRRLAKELATH